MTGGDDDGDDDDDDDDDDVFLEAPTPVFFILYSREVLWYGACPYLLFETSTLNLYDMILVYFHIIHIYIYIHVSRHIVSFSGFR